MNGMKVIAVALVCTSMGTRHGKADERTAHERQSHMETGTCGFSLQANLIIIDVRVNGAPGQFILDTGASTTVLAREFADKLGLQEADRLAGAGAGGTLTLSLVKVDHVAAVGLTDRDLSCPVMDISNIRDQVGDNIDGLLGFDFFGAGSLHVDYANRRVTVTRPVRNERSPTASVAADRVVLHQFDVAVTIPSQGWTATADTPLPSIATTLTGPGGASVAVSTVASQGLSVATMKASLDASIRAQVDEFEAISSRDAKRAGKPAYHVEYAGVDEGVRKRFISEAILFDAGLVVLTASAEVQAFETVRPAMEGILDSVKSIR